MTVLDLIVSTTLPWAILHLVRFLYSNRQHKLVRNILPLPLSGDPGASRRRGTWEIGPLWLKYETTRWNSVFSYSVLTLFSRGRRRRLLDGNTPGSATLARWGTRFYIVGAALCVLAMALGMILLFWSALALVWRVARLLTGGTESLEPDALREGMTRVVKRFINEGETTNNDAKLDRPRLHVLVPGITVPLSHLPILVLGLAFSGIIHEAGHAIAASLDNLRMLSTGFHIHLVFPTFFVSVSHSLAMRPVPSRLRVATAGAWHNFVTWGLLTLLGLSAFSIKDLYPLPNSSSPDISGSGVCILASASSCSPSGFSSQFRPPSRLWHYLGYDDISQRGIVITQVQSHSPLYGHLLPGSVITHVDDVRLGTDDSGLESGNGLRRWHSHLGMDPAHWARKVQDEAGWCVPETWFSRQSGACCHTVVGNSTAHHHESAGPESCFVSLTKASGEKYAGENPDNERCLDPVSLFTYQHSLSRGGSPFNPTLPSITPHPDTSAGKGSKSGSAYGSRCHVTCLHSDGDDEEYVCARPRAHASREGGGIDPMDERLLRLEIEDPPWIEHSNGSPLSTMDIDPTTEEYVTREGVPKPFEYRLHPHHYHPRPARSTRILVYKGPTSEILTHVSVGSLQPRSQYFPPLRLPHYVGDSIPTLFGLFWEYVARLSLSLAFFNLLPIVGLDGGAVFSCLLEWCLGLQGVVDTKDGEEYDVGSLERGAGTGAGTRRGLEDRSVPAEKRRAFLEKWTSVLTIVLGFMVVVATFWQDIG